MNIQRFTAEGRQTINWASGTSTELFIHPSNGSFVDRNFLFRISTATVEAEESTFTFFEGITRHLMILKGRLELVHEGRYTKLLEPFDQDVFSGEWSTRSKGKVTDFNLMLKDGATGSLTHRRVEKDSSALFTAATDNYFIYLSSGVATLDNGNTAVAGDLLLIGKGPELTIHALETCDLVVIEVVLSSEAQRGAPKTATIISKDGTAIAYEKAGNGPGIILVNGALAHRNLYGEQELAGRLAKDFTVIFYDRRGRGESSDTKPYSVAREIEDIEALIEVVGGSACLFGSSGGAALALLAAAELGPRKILRLALYEPPYGSDSREEYIKEKDRINELIHSGQPADAVTFYMGRRGVPSDKLEAMKQSPEWREIVDVAPTLVYDFEVLGDGSIPVDVAKNITIPTLVMNGEKSFDFMKTTADTIGKIILNAVRKTIRDQAHDVSPEAIAPLLAEFFHEQTSTEKVMIPFA